MKNTRWYLSKLSIAALSKGMRSMKRLESFDFVSYITLQSDRVDGHEMGANPHELINPPPRAPFPVVRLRNLPYSCRKEDVAHFFLGLHIVDIIFVYRNNVLTGEALCVLANAAGVKFAIGKNKQKMGKRCVKVFRSRRHDYYKTVANKVSYYEGREFKNTRVLRLCGLPYSVEKKEIVDFFKDFMVAEESVHITTNSKGKPEGEAFVEFNNARASKAAMAKDKMMVRD